MYLYFRTPSPGHLSIYALQEDGVAYRLLPYAEMTTPYDDSVPMEADREYIFFHPSSNHHYFPDFPFRRVDELKLETNQSSEWIEFYIVFSTSSFNKPLLATGRQQDRDLPPKSLSKEKFEEWIRDNRIHNPDFNYIIKRVEITKG